MINVKGTIYKTLLQKVHKLRYLAQTNEKAFKRILTLVILDDMYDWAGQLNQPQSILKELKEARTQYILSNCDFLIDHDKIGSDFYSNVNTPQSLLTWTRLFDSEYEELVPKAKGKFTGIVDLTKVSLSKEDKTLNIIL